jgi:hypothetical protein
MESDMITLQPLYEWKVETSPLTGKAAGRLVPTGLRPTFLRKFERRGIEVPPALFGQPPVLTEVGMSGIDRAVGDRGAAW